MSNVQTVLFTGPPGAGKGTQSKLLAEKLIWGYAATGDHFRSLAGRNNDIGRRIRDQYATGALLPSAFTSQFLLRVFTEAGRSESFVLDGFARTIAQAKELHDMLTWFDRPYRVINLEADDAVVAARMALRAASEQRADSDTPEKIRRRIEDYRRESRPVLEFFKGARVLRSINAEQSVETVAQTIASFF